MLPEEQCPGSFMKNCVNNLKKNLDSLIYYGISRNALRPPIRQSVGKYC